MNMSLLQRSNNVQQPKPLKRYSCRQPGTFGWHMLVITKSGDILDYIKKDLESTSWCLLRGTLEWRS